MASIAYPLHSDKMTYGLIKDIREDIFDLGIERINKIIEIPENFKPTIREVANLIIVRFYLNWKKLLREANSPRDSKTYQRLLKLEDIEKE